MGGANDAIFLKISWAKVSNQEEDRICLGVVHKSGANWIVVHKYMGNWIVAHKEKKGDTLRKRK